MIWTARQQELHDHYASNAQACGHTATCALVTTRRNWPTIMGRPKCDCGYISVTIVGDDNRPRRSCRSANGECSCGWKSDATDPGQRDRDEFAHLYGDLSPRVQASIRQAS